MSPDQNDRHRGIGPSLPDDPEGDAVPFVERDDEPAPSTPPPRDPWGPWAPIGALVSTPPPPTRWLLRTATGAGVLQLGKVAILAAAGGVGKTMTALDLAVAVATGGVWLGAFHVAERGRVLLLLGEEDPDEVHRRFWNATRSLSAGERDAVADRIVAVPLAGNAGIALVRRPDEGDDARTDAARSLLSRVTDGGPWSLIVLDPLARFAGPDTEKDNTVATRTVQVFEALTSAPGTPTVLVVAHTSQTARESGNRGASAVRGVTGITDGTRWVGTLVPEGDLVWFTVAKSNNARIPPAVLLGRDEHGRLRAATDAERAGLDEQRGEASPKRRGAERSAPEPARAAPARRPGGIVDLDAVRRGATEP